MKLTHEQRDWLCLALTPGVGTARFIRLLARFGTPGRVLKASQSELRDIVGPALAARIRQHAETADLDLQESAMAEHEVALITMDDPQYPALLAEIYDPPLSLYVRGTLLESDQYAVAIVGTRKASAFGLKMAHKLAYGLAERGIVVVSGLAEGIDSAAHRGALDAGGRTIAVLGSGHDQVFPAANAELLHQVIRQGCAITSFPMGMRALKQNFPQRNRILSGLCLGVVVVEAPPGSGSLITAKYAAEQGREVFAVPGPAGLANSRGPHELIRDGARLVESVEDIVVELNVPPAMRQAPSRPSESVTVERQASLDFSAPAASRKKAAPPAVPESAPEPAKAVPQSRPALSSQETAILEILHPEGSFVDEIALACRISISEALASLTLLELKGAVRQLSGKRFAPR